MGKLSSYAAVSAACALGIIYYASSTRRQFYPVMYFISHSKISLIFLLNMGFVIMCATWQLVNAVFLGPLRETELERLNEQCWKEVMEILFAMTVFRDEFDLKFVFFITVLLFIKTYHWLAQKRVEYIETTPSVPRLSHVRLCTFMALLLTLDCLFFHRSFSHLLKTRQASVSLFFAFEYVILATTTVKTFIKYALHVREMASEGHWTGKAVCIFYLELVQDLLHLSLYLIFFMAIFMHYGLPLHLVRELYETFRNFKNRIADFIRYRRLTSNMNERFPDATPEEIIRDATCIVCREEMIGAKKLPCGHLFHVHCLRSWLERQHTCPTCRAPMLASEDDFPSDNSEEDMGPDAQLYEEENDFAADDNALAGQEEMAVDNGFVNSSNIRQLHAAATLAAAQYGNSFMYPAFTSGGPIWYPMFIPYLPQLQAVGPSTQPVNRDGVNIESRIGCPSFESSIRQNFESHTGLADCQTPPMHQWAWIPLISQTSAHPNQLGQDAMQPWQYPPGVPISNVTRGTTLSCTTLDQRTSSSLGITSSAGSTVCWIPGTLSVSHHADQLAYLKRVAEILQKQLQSTIDLQNQLSSMMADNPATLENSGIEEPAPADVLSILQIDNKDHKGKALVHIGKDHCEHCSLAHLKENIDHSGIV